MLASPSIKSLFCWKNKHNQSAQINTITKEHE